MNEGGKTERNAESGTLSRGRKPAVPKAVSITITIFVIVIIAVYFYFPSGARKENTSLPKYRSSNFTKVIHAPSVLHLSIWKDNQGRDCLASLEKPWHSNALVSIYTNDFELANRFELTSGPKVVFTFVAYKPPESDYPNIYLSAVYNKKQFGFESYNSSGNLLYSITSKHLVSRMFIVDSPSSPGTPLIAVFESKYPQSLFIFYNILDFSQSSQDTLLIGQYLQRAGYITGITTTDWDFDGKPDAVYWGRDANGDDILLPVVSGNVGPPVPLGQVQPVTEKHYTSAFAAAIYIENNTDNVVVAFYQKLWREKSDSKIANFIYKYYRPPIFEGSKIYWKNLQTGAEITKEFLSPHATIEYKSILLEDLTGDGIPEVIAAVDSTRLVVYDLDGKELYNKLLFKHSIRYWGISNLLSGDFDGDGKKDIAFTYMNGIFIPDLSALRN